MLAYVYGVVPFSLCRNGGTCRSSPNATNSVANSNSNLSSEDAVIGPLDEDLATGLHLRGDSSTADVGSLDIVTHQQLHGKATSPDEQLMLRMMMVLDENDVFVNGGGSIKEDAKSVGEPLSARIRHRAEINHSAGGGGGGGGSQVEQTASIGEFSMDSCDVHSRKLVLMDPSGQSITDTDAVRLTEERDDAVARIRINDEEKSNFDSASTLAFHLSAWVLVDCLQVDLLCVKLVGLNFYNDWTGLVQDWDVFGFRMNSATNLSSIWLIDWLIYSFLFY